MTATLTVHVESIAASRALLRGATEAHKLDEELRRTEEALREALRRAAAAAGSAHPRPVLAPGTRQLELLRYLFSRKTVATVFEPMINDLRFEYNEALLSGRPKFANWVRVRYTLCLAMVIAQLTSDVFGQFVKGLLHHRN